MQVSACLSQGATRETDPEDIYAKENDYKESAYVLWSLVSLVHITGEAVMRGRPQALGHKS